MKKQYYRKGQKDRSDQKIRRSILYQKIKRIDVIKKLKSSINHQIRRYIVSIEINYLIEKLKKKSFLLKDQNNESDQKF